MDRRLLTAISLLVVLVLLAIVALSCGTDASTPQASTPQGGPQGGSESTSKRSASSSQTESKVTGATSTTVIQAEDATTTTTEPTVTASTEAARLEPIVVPTLPEEIPGYVEEDPATGLHMTGTPVEVDFARYHLVVDGKVANELSLTYDEIRSLPKITATPELLCPGVFLDTATWSGAPLVLILDMAGLQPDAEEIHLESADGYSVYLPLDRALLDENFLAYELEGETLPVLHGFPLRAVFPDELGAYWIKWLVHIEVA